MVLIRHLVSRVKDHTCLLLVQADRGIGASPKRVKIILSPCWQKVSCPEIALKRELSRRVFALLYEVERGRG
jgi:hypothetical protein